MSGWLPPAPRSLRGRLLRRALQMRDRLLPPEQDPRFVRVQGARLRLLPGVFDPQRFRSGALLAEAVRLDRPRRLCVLDLGTGSGVGAVLAARGGALRVVATDIDPPAVRCARGNAHRLGLDDVIEVRQGDLFSPVAGERFDRVLFNPPFFRGQPRDAREQAWCADDVIERFAAGLPGALRPGGSALVVLSTDGACRDLPPLLEEAGLQLSELHRRSWPDEIQLVLRARLPGKEARPSPEASR